MKIPISQYAAMHDKTDSQIRRMIIYHKLLSGEKIDGKWYIDKDTPYPEGKYKKHKKFSVLSLSSGCGGMDLGFLGGFKYLGKLYKRTSFVLIGASDADPAACETYRKNFWTPIINVEANGVLIEVIGLKEYRESRGESIDVILGSFDCRDIPESLDSLWQFPEKDNPFRACVEAVGNVRPKVFVAECTGALMAAQHEQRFMTLLNAFSDMRYKVTCKLYHAQDYGIPQIRGRYYLVATREDMPEFVHPKPTTPSHPVTVKEAIGDLELREQDKEFSHVWGKARNVEHPQPPQQILVADKPSYMINAECHGRMHIHYSQPRKISLREAARIQSFPDTFIFPSGMRETERQIGSAVPPVLAWHIATALERQLFKDEKY